MFEPPPGRRRKKVDYEALQSPLKRIPGLSVPDVRDLLDLGLRQLIDLQGRAPAVLFEEIRKLRPETPPERLWSFRLAVYYAETDSPDPQLLAPWRWQEERY